MDFFTDHRQILITLEASYVDCGLGPSIYLFLLLTGNKFLLKRFYCIPEIFPDYKFSIRSLQKLRQICVTTKYKCLHG